MAYWNKGDLAHCVDDQPCHCCHAAPPLTTGTVYRVEYVFPLQGNRKLLKLEGIDAGNRHFGNAFNSGRFRKISPSEDGFAAQLRASIDQSQELEKEPICEPV